MMKKPILFVALLLLTLICTCCKKKEYKFHIDDFHNFSRTFNDLNDTHLSVAHRIGISPISSRLEAEKHLDKLNEIESCKLYKIDSLTNSVPFLVEKAAMLLDTIGQNFQDSLESKDAPPYRLVVTSILRTHDDIKNLRQNNGNSSLKSAHLFGTTFDIAYTRYEKEEEETLDIPEDKLKAVLAEVLRDLQERGRCYVRYEVKQGCFHITARP